ncbi:MAG TPA: 2Fe-2S iron-sulfur cluster-binding protein, partial [Candidatus Dormibacteraeota bacterium]|nr:2Fe-2S iron-sulfur cluster-binding protein [Candidatus Dormibacteraeota bacterium]
RDRRAGLPVLRQRAQDIEALVRELAAADAATLGLGIQPERGPGHEGLRVLNIRGTGACNSDCVFCVEKFDPAHRTMPKADATRQFILDNAGQYDMLFFASGEPTIHPKLFEYVELAREVGFTSFGMSSHFRTFADPAFTLRVLQAGFEYFDISLHAADIPGQLAVNPIGDDGASLLEALKGVAVLYRLAEALGVRISVTHKVVVSRLNVGDLDAIFRATYDRGVRHFILQPVRAMNLDPERRTLLAIGEDEILPHLNAFLAHTEGLGATVKPYGFSRQNLFAGTHVETEQNRVKNVYGRNRGGGVHRAMQGTQEERPRDGRHWVEVRMSDSGHRFQFAATGAVPMLDEALERGHELPFGCRMGSCGMCCARLLEGEVDQSGQFFLTEEQVRDGYVLLCQARPKGDVVVRLCTDDELDPL